MTSSINCLAATLAGSDACNWFPDNLRQIHTHLAAQIQKPQHAPLVAVFDFDNTCIFRDIGQAAFYYQLRHLHYRLHPEQLAALLPQGEQVLAGRPLAAITASLLDCYSSLFPFLLRGNNTAALNMPASQNFATLLHWFTCEARKEPSLGPRYVLPFMAKLFAGFSCTEMRNLAATIVAEACAEPLLETWRRASFQEPIGSIAVQYPLGMHIHPEMLALMHTLTKNSIACYVISASAEWLVQGAVQALGFPVPDPQVFGIRVLLDAEETLTIHDPVAYPVTYREGKAEIITRWIGGQPCLVAGDADTDYEMLTLPNVPIRLLINRCQCGLISSLYQHPDILLQGLDMRTGRFRPDRTSVGV